MLLENALLLLSAVAAGTAIGIVSIPSELARHAKTKFDDFSERFLLPDDFVNAAKTPVVKPTGEQIEAMQNSLLFEGDIVGVPNDELPPLRMRDDPMLDDDEVFRRPYHSSLNLVTYPDKLWTDGQVPYMLEEGMTTEQRAAIAQAFDEYKQKTCVRFVPRNDDDFDYIYIKRNVAFGCSSYVGRAGGNQTVSLEVDKCFSKGIIAHELMHALGFFHEHSRTDRDQFVDIVEDNIRPGMMRNFEKYPRKIIDPLGMPYDYDSVMHYHKLAFSRNGKPTIVPRDGQAEVGQRYKLSEVDSQKINKLYQCGEYKKVTTSTTTTTTTTTTPKPQTRLPTTSEESEEIDTTTRKSTPTTTTTTTTATTTTTKEQRKLNKKCEDLNAHCGMWEQLGHCQHSVKYMAHYCRRSCSFCDDDVSAATTAKPPRRSGEKEKEKEKEKVDKCEDKNLFCGYWARIGECKSESKFMKIFCKASCGKC